MAKTIVYGTNRPSEEHIEWFAKHVGPRTHYLMGSVGGEGWRFAHHKDNPYTQKGEWHLTVQDEKMLMYWTLVRV